MDFFFFVVVCFHFNHFTLGENVLSFFILQFSKQNLVQLGKRTFLSSDFSHVVLTSPL